MTSKKWSRLLCLVLCLAVMLSCVSVAAAEEKTKITAQLLRLRATASVKGRVIDAFPKGTEVTILKKGSEWTKVRVRNKTGYMQTKFLAYSRGSSSSGRAAPVRRCTSRRASGFTSGRRRIPVPTSSGRSGAARPSPS